MVPYTQIARSGHDITKNLTFMAGLSMATIAVAPTTTVTNYGGKSYTGKEKAQWKQERKWYKRK